MKTWNRTRLASGLAMVVLLGSAVEAVGLPKAISLLGRDSPEIRLHNFVQRSTKYVSPEWGGDLHRYVGPFPVHFRGYVSGRLGF